MKKYGIALCYLLVFGAIVWGGKKMDSKINCNASEENVLAASHKTMLYEDSELGFSFEANEELYSMLICEIGKETKDEDIQLNKIEAEFYGVLDGNRVPFFQVTVYQGGFEEAYLKEQQKDSVYLGSEKGYTYTMQLLDGREYVYTQDALELYEKIYNNYVVVVEDSLEITGAEQGLFSGDNQAMSSLYPQISYKEEVVPMEGGDEILLLAKSDSNLGYSVTFEPKFFGFSMEGDMERYVAKNEEGDDYPNIYFTIKKELGQTLDDLTNAFAEETSLRKEKIQIGNEETQYMARQFVKEEGSGNNKIITRYVFIEHEEAVYIVELSYFSEDTDGYSEKLQKMLDSIELSQIMQSRETIG